MRPGARLQLGLILAAALLAAAVWWLGRVERAAAPPKTLLPLSAAEIIEIEVRVGRDPLRHFTRGADGWQMRAPLTGPADAAHLERLARIAAAPVLRWRPLAEFDVAKIGLDPPWATVRLNGELLRFGELAALAPQRYVRRGDHVALIAARYGADIAASPESELASAAGTLPTL